MPYRALVAADGAQLIDVEQLIDYPWMTVTRLRYDGGTRYDLVCCEVTESEDFAVFYNAILPAGAVAMEIRESNTLPDAAIERTCSFWSAE